METFRFTTKTDLVTALERKRRACKRIDAEAKRERKAEADEALRLIKSRLRERKAWTVAQWSKVGFSVLDRYSEAPSSRCVQSKESMLDRLLAELKLTQQERFSVSSKGSHSTAHRLLTIDLDVVKTICG